jgi:iron(III) transport system permease protein
MLPLAIPSFVMGFIYIGLLDFTGPVQTAFRQAFGASARLPVHGILPAAFVLSLSLYPYVYLLARTAFRDQGLAALEAARLLGSSRRGAFVRLVLPLARPALVAGITLALMETLTDFATVRYFNVPTLSEGVIRIWQGQMERQNATELAALLLLFALLLIVIERALRGDARYHQLMGRGSARALPAQLRGAKAWIACLICVTILIFGFGLPVEQLVAWTLEEANNPLANVTWATFQQHTLNTIIMAGAGTLVTLALALVLAYTVRRNRSSRIRWIIRAATLGYAMPGAVVAVGVLLALSPLDHAINDTAERLGWTAPGLILTGTLIGLVYAYAVRFMAVGYNSVEASFEKISPSLDAAASTLGARSGRVLRRIHVPLISSGVIAGSVLVFMDIVKELPATFLLRPFGMDTLAVWSYMMASESWWTSAAPPALVIVLVELIPVALLIRLNRPDTHTAKSLNDQSFQYDE